MWRCPGCNETIDDAFNACWKCGTSHRGDSDSGFKHADLLTASETSEGEAITAGFVGGQASDAAPVPAASLSPRIVLTALILLVGVLAVGWYIERPSTSQDFFARGSRYLARDEHRAAIEDFSEALRRLDHRGDPSDGAAIYFARAVAYNNTGEYEDAVEDATEALRRTPETGSGFCMVGDTPMLGFEHVLMMHVVRANAYLELDDPSKAIDDLKAVLKRQPDHSTARRLLAIAKRKDAGEVFEPEPE
ncbi:MAG: tetratricopeptide repeat protein [Planctomycetota bacterium]|nr:MAG: tetratricopeptide repeat protein [Planctomycetota bacterium]REJ94900.1 MAG: tetratricopeptide repeat protein [Planctomycetota bacterium]REK27278.1 MAG: tetratricopeptide repeat protein [Planctomycetota bacterium]REK36701.1 MAG: tetratricopeptide repeat protein [Planctomycetota bacterium]